MTKSFCWGADKNEQLVRERGLSFERVVVAIESGDLLQILQHQNPEKYPRQKIMVIMIDAYAHLVPYVEKDDFYFLKTIIPSRKATRDFLTAKE